MRRPRPSPANALFIQFVRSCERRASLAAASRMEMETQGMRNALLLGPAFTALLALSACDPVTLAAVSASAVSFAATDKFPADHLASWITGRDCSLHLAADTRQYCRDPIDESKLAAAPLYCYRTLGAITCYAAPDPQASDSRRVQ